MMAAGKRGADINTWLLSIRATVSSGTAQDQAPGKDKGNGTF
jgi:hypothetical protein